MPKLSVIVQPLFVIREHTLERSLTNVRTAERLSARAHLLQSIKRLTLEKNHINVKSVENISAKVLLSLNIRKLMLQGKAVAMERLLVSIQPLVSKKDFILYKN